MGVLRVDSSTVAEGVRREGETGESARTFTAGQGLFLVETRENAQVDELSPVLVAEAEFSGRTILEIEVDTPDAVVHTPSDAGGGEVVRSS